VLNIVFPGFVCKTKKNQQKNIQVRHLENALEVANLDSSKYHHSRAIIEDVWIRAKINTTSRDNFSSKRRDGSRNTSLRVRESNKAQTEMPSGKSTSSRSTRGLQETVKGKAHTIMPEHQVKYSMSAAPRKDAAVQASRDTPLAGETRATSRHKPSSAGRSANSNARSQAEFKDQQRSPVVKQRRNTPQRGERSSPGSRFLAQHYSSLWVGYGPGRAPGSPPISISPPWK